MHHTLWRKGSLFPASLLPSGTQSQHHRQFPNQTAEVLCLGVKPSQIKYTAGSPKTDVDTFVTIFEGIG